MSLGKPLNRHELKRDAPSQMFILSVEHITAMFLQVFLKTYGFMDLSYSWISHFSMINRTLKIKWGEFNLNGTIHQLAPFMLNIIHGPLIFFWKGYQFKWALLWHWTIVSSRWGLPESAWRVIGSYLCIWSNMRDGVISGGSVWIGSVLWIVKLGQWACLRGDL